MLGGPKPGMKGSSPQCLLRGESGGGDELEGGGEEGGEVGRSVVSDSREVDSEVSSVW